MLPAASGKGTSQLLVRVLVVLLMLLVAVGCATVAAGCGYSYILMSYMTMKWSFMCLFAHPAAVMVCQLSP